jgi:hypothetical protein
MDDDERGVSDAPDNEDIQAEEVPVTAMTLREMWNARLSNKPDISCLREAIDWDTPDGEPPRFIPRRNEYVVIERRSVSLKNRPWLDTRVYMLREDPRDDGYLSLWDPIRRQLATSNWKTGVLEKFDFRLPPQGRNPETLFEDDLTQRRKRKLRLTDKPPRAR